jgi:hypothetical protein
MKKKKPGTHAEEGGHDFLLGNGTVVFNRENNRVLGRGKRMVANGRKDVAETDLGRQRHACVVTASSAKQ